MQSSDEYSSYDSECEGEADIEEIVNHRAAKPAGTYEFEVRFVAFPEKCNLWYHQRDLEETMPEGVKEYMESHRLGKYKLLKKRARSPSPDWSAEDQSSSSSEEYSSSSEDEEEDSSSHRSPHRSRSRSASPHQSRSRSPSPRRMSSSSSSEDVPLWKIAGLPDPNKLPEDWDLTQVCTYFQTHPVPAHVAERKRKELIDEWAKNRGLQLNFTRLSSEDTRHMFDLIDRDMFAGKIGEYLTRNNYSLKVVPGSKSTNTAGWCKYMRQGGLLCGFTISLSTEVFAETFNEEETCHVANGIGCCSRAECMEIVLEHEIVHMLVRLFCPHTGKSHGKNFMTIARGLFGHKDFYHSLHRGDGMELLADLDTGTKNRDLIRKLKRNKGTAWVTYRTVKVRDLYGEDPEITDRQYEVRSVGPRNIVLVDGRRMRHGDYHIVGIHRTKDGENLMSWSEDFRSEESENDRGRYEEDEEEVPSWIEQDDDIMQEDDDYEEDDGGEDENEDDENEVSDENDKDAEAVKEHSKEEIESLVEEMIPTKEAFNDINEYLLKSKDYIGLKQFGEVFAHAWGWLLYLQEKYGPLICTWMPDEHDKKNAANYRDKDGIFYLYSKGGFNVQPWAGEQIVKCLEKSRFALGILALRSTFYHANAIIFDGKHKTVTRFEPHGAHTGARGTSFSEGVDKSIASWVSNPKKGGKLLGDGWTYHPPSSFCPTEGPQSKEGKSSIKVSQRERSGYCEIWSLMFLQYRMMNPDVPNSEIIEYMMNPYTADELRTRIREYGAFIANMVTPDWQEVATEKKKAKSEKFQHNKNTFKVGTYFKTTHKTPYYGVVTSLIESGKEAGKYARAYLLGYGNMNVHFTAMEPLHDQKIIDEIKRKLAR